MIFVLVEFFIEVLGFWVEIKRENFNVVSKNNVVFMFDWGYM